MKCMDHTSKNRFHTPFCWTSIDEDGNITSETIGALFKIDIPSCFPCKHPYLGASWYFDDSVEDVGKVFLIGDG